MSKRRNKWMIDVREAKPLSRRERERVTRNTLGAFDRAVLFPVDQFALDQHRRRVIFWLDIACAAVAFGIVVCLIALVLRA